MAPKGRKSFTSNWYACDSCGVTLSQKDVQQHNVSCPPDGNDWQHPFIRNNTLFSFLEQSDVNDGPKVREHEKQFFVYLSQSAMQLCHLEIGEQVVLLKESQSVVRTVWPTSEKSLTSVTIPTLLPGMSQKFYEEGKKMRVTKLLTKPIPALSISLTTNDDISEEISEQLILVCKQLYGGKILKTGSDMFLPFCGKFITFKVDISYKMENDNTEDLVQNLESLNIKGDEEKYFVAVDTTEWKIFKKSDLNRDQLIKKIGLQDVGGYKEVTKELTDTISHALRNNNNQTYFSTSMGILLYGPNGVGKTYICEAVVNETNAHIIQINSGELFSKFFGETELRLRKLFEEAKSKSPSIIVLDNVDTLCSKRSGTEQERRVTAYLLTLIDSLKNHKTVVLATTSQLNHIDPALRRPGRLDCEIELPIPSAADRLAILKVLLARWSVDDADVTKVAQAAHGYVAADLQCLVTKTAMQASTQGKSQLEASHLYWALSQIKPSAMREVQVQVPNVKWTDIGGMDELKLKLQQSIEWPLRHPEAFARLGITPPRGVLMYGPPGCSKTMIAKALATESKLNFLSIKGSELFSKWVGESEKAVQAVFKKARAVAPSIIFLDELDALGGERGGGAAEGGSNVQERVLAQMLTEMDGVEPLGNVNIVAATNRPDRIDKALLRPGRLDRLIYVPLPDLATRICILQLQLIKMPVARDIVIDDLALKTEGYSGAEVIAVCHEAAINALQEDFNMNEIHIRHFAAALETVKPRTPESLLKLYDSYKK